MIENRLTIRINKPVAEVFEFLLNPKNTPLWIESVVEEKTNEWPIKAGSIYRNQNNEEIWSEYRVALLNRYKMFEFVSKDNNYHVKYTFKRIGNNSCELEYFEWVEKGDLEGPFTQDILEKLKAVLES